MGQLPNPIHLRKELDYRSVRDLYEDKDDLYIVMEYLQGGDLADYIDNNDKISEQTAAKILKQIANGINYMKLLIVIGINPRLVVFNMAHIIPIQT